MCDRLGEHGRTLGKAVGQRRMPALGVVHAKIVRPEAIDDDQEHVVAHKAPTSALVFER